MLSLALGSHTWALVTPGGYDRGGQAFPNTSRPGESLGLRFPTLEEQLLVPGASCHPPSHPQPLAKRCHLQPKDAAKLPESAWKFLFYLGCWSYSAYLLFGTDYPFFHDPPSAFYGRGLGGREGGLCLKHTCTGHRPPHGCLDVKPAPR